MLTLRKKGVSLASLAKGGGTAEAVTEGLEERIMELNPSCHFVTFPLYKGDKEILHGIEKQTATPRRASINACRVKFNNRFCGKTVSINADPTEEGCISCLPCKGRWHGTE